MSPTFCAFFSREKSMWNKRNWSAGKTLYSVCFSSSNSGIKYGNVAAN